MLILFSVGILSLFSCSKEDNKESAKLPVIVLDVPNFTYNVKVGKMLTISPTYENAENATFVWSEKGKVISTKRELTYSWDEIGAKYISLVVKNAVGEKAIEIKVNVMQQVPPVINYIAPQEGLKVMKGVGFEFTPLVENDDEASYEWYLNGAKVSTSKNYTFTSDSEGLYTIKFVVTTEDGSDEFEFTVTVCKAEDIPFNWDFEKDIYYLSTGRSVNVRIRNVQNDFDANYTFTLNGTEVKSGKELFYVFDKKEQGEYTLLITMKNQYTTLTKNIKIVVCPAEGTYKRAATSASNVRLNKVYEFLAAPGQFVNEGYTANTMEEAISYAESRIIDGGGNTYLSLGAWGGSVVVGFDHSIDNDGDYNFQIKGNSFNGSSEPGVVWVMQDENGDGLPNDTWFELKGSAYDKSNRDYFVTYYKPSAPKMAVQWTDSEGNSGTVDYLASFHKQDYYYPNWVTTPSYTIYGTKLPAQTSQDGSGLWFNGSLEWGYADNFSSVDRIIPTETTINHFRISNAITWDGKPANLQYIDFIKVQTGVNAKAGILGENSTEVLDFNDYNLIK